ncbi:UNVERIFIED_CONTAM: putative clathrin assembly protein [Sesamum indicum]
MAAGSGSSQQNLRKAILAIRDSTKVGIAKVNSEYKDLKVSILKATNHLEVLPKEKHFLVRDPEQMLVIAYIHLQGVLAKHVALKTLIVIHRALREVDHSFCEELIYHNQGGGHLLNLSHFRDDSSPSAWDYSTWIRSYALYIEECLECFRVLKYDFHRDHTPVGAARYNFIIQYALSIVAAESVRLYVGITDGVLILVDKGGVLDRSILDSLYDTAVMKANTNGPYQIANVSSNPFEADDYNQEMFYDPSRVGHPSFMQVQQAAFMQQQAAPQQSQAVVPFDYMQIAGITQPQQPALVQNQDSSFTGDDFMQMIPMPQPEVSMMMQQQDISMVGIDSSNPFGNPFMEQVSLPVSPQSQPSTLSLL